ncbi:MAG: hypothetical protein V4858_17110 [Pseudomonadota bacterium]
MNLQITSTQPIPAHAYRTEKHSEFRLFIQLLEVGESVFYDGMSLAYGKSYCSKQGSYNNKRFTTAPEGDGFRCWRVQ